MSEGMEKPPSEKPFTRVDLHYDCCCGHRRYANMYETAIEYRCDINDARGPCHGFVDGIGCTLADHKCDEIITESARNDRFVAQEFLSWELFTRLSVPPFFCMIGNHKDERVAVTLLQSLVDVTVLKIDEKAGKVIAYFMYFPANEDDVKKVCNFGKLVAESKRIDLMAGLEPHQKYMKMSRCP